MKKYAIKLTKNNQKKILATYANAEDAFFYGGKVSNELPKSPERSVASMRTLTMRITGQIKFIS